MGLGEIMRPMRTWRGPQYRGEGIIGNRIARRYKDVDNKTRVENQRAEALIPEGVVELRVHGVNGGTPEQNLHDPGPVQVSGDDTAGFYRRRSELNSGPERTVEAYNWSSINSKKSIRSWWLVLFPFAAANFAGWLLPKEMADRPRRRVAAQIIVRLIGLCVTLIAVQGAALVFVDLIGVQCGTMDGCKTEFTWGWVGSIAGWGIVDDRPVRLAMMYSLLPAVAILALWLLGRRSRAYEAYGAGTPNPDVEGWKRPIGKVIDEVRMDHVEFWQAPDVVYVQAWLHATAGLATLTAVMAFAVREIQDGAQHHDNLYLLGLLAMVLLGITVVAMAAVSRMHQIPRLWLRKRNLAFYLPRWSWVPAGFAIALFGLTFWAGWLSVGGTGQDQAPLESIRNALIWTTVPAVGLVLVLAVLVGAFRSVAFTVLSGVTLFYFLEETSDGFQITLLTGNQWFGLEVVAALILILGYRYRSASFEKWPTATDHSANPTWIFGTTALLIVAGAAAFFRVESGPVKLASALVPVFYLWQQFAIQIRNGHDLPAKEEMREGTAAVIAGLAVTSALTAVSSSALFVAGRLGETRALPRSSAGGESDFCLSTTICYPAEIGWYALAAAAGIIVLVVSVGFRLLLLRSKRWKRKHKDEPHQKRDQLCDAYDTAAKKAPADAYDINGACANPDHDEERLEFAKQAVNARWYANVTDDADWVIGAAVMTTITLLVAAAVARIERTLPTSDTNALFDAASWALGFVVVGVGLLIYAARDNKQLRATMGILWDVMSFFPRRFHPLAPPCYAERAVIDVRNRLIYMTTRGKELTTMRDSNVILLGHSEGSLITTAALLSLLPNNINDQPLLVRHPGHPEPTGGELSHVAFVTYGCMLARLYGRAWPDQLPESILRQLKKALEGDTSQAPVGDDFTQFVYHGQDRISRWMNFGRYSDYLGGRVFQELQRKPIDDCRSPEHDYRCDDVFFDDPTRRWRWHGQLEHARLWRHSFDYESDTEDPRFREHVWAIARVFRKETERDVVADYPWMSACTASHTPPAGT